MKYKIIKANNNNKKHSKKKKNKQLNKNLYYINIC